MTRYEAYRRQIDKGLREVIDCRIMPERLREAMAYSLLADGKRLRPVLFLAAYGLRAENSSFALPYALALEMIHAYSLIHDDLPAMDDDDFRRGKPSNHKVFGEGVAILAGDGLLSLAFETMLQVSLVSHDAARSLQTMEVIARRAGTGGMVGGQIADITMEGKQPEPDMITYIHTHKTADLFIAALEGGLRLAGASEEEVEAGVSFGFHYGMAYQMADDLLDISRDQVEPGCKTAGDSARGKLTWPSFAGYAETLEEIKSRTDRAIRSLRPFGHSGKFLKALAKDVPMRVQ